MKITIYIVREEEEMIEKNIFQYFGSKQERIYRVLLSNKIQKPSGYKIAKLAEVSYPYVHTILGDLEREGILKDRQIVEVKKLFNYWANHRGPNYLREYNIQNPKDILKNAKLDYAFTGYFAENLIGGYLFPRYYELYIKDYEFEKWDKYLLKSGYLGKGNVRIYCSDHHVFFEKHMVEDWPVVSIQQLIVDLIREGAECGEAGERLMKMIYNA
ncbi:MAG: hypothetical protein WC379_13480 [Methanoregula sp.]